MDAREHADVVLVAINSAMCGEWGREAALTEYAALRARVEELEREQSERQEMQERSREGMVTVYDHELNYVGCMGRESWAWLLEHGYERCRSDAARVATLEAALETARLRHTALLTAIDDGDDHGEHVGLQRYRRAVYDGQAEILALFEKPIGEGSH